MADREPGEEKVRQRDEDRDALHILPLAILPMETKSLLRARLIKNVRLESVVELFVTQQTGSGQMDVDALPKEFGWPGGVEHKDYQVLKRLAPLPSYDVYSLRILLRECGIKVNDVDDLKLSEKRVRELNSHMASFTRPLIREIYGDDSREVAEFGDLLDIFRDPDVKRVRVRLETMASRLNIGLEEVPRFLEDYGDIFLSLSYYRKCLEEIEPIVEGFTVALDALKSSWQFKNDRVLVQTCESLRSLMVGLVGVLNKRFRAFDEATQDLWDDLTAARFRAVKTLIEDYHTAIGSILCALTVKMDAWHALFPDLDTGGPAKRAEFIMTDMRQGTSRLRQYQDR